MCMQTTRTPRERVLTSQAKVFFEGKNRPLYVAETEQELSLQLASGEPVLRMTNLLNEATSIPASRIVSIVQVLPRPEKPVDAVAILSQATETDFRSALDKLQAADPTLDMLDMGEGIDLLVVGNRDGAVHVLGEKVVLDLEAEVVKAAS